MKNIVFLWIVALLFSSCYNYEITTTEKVRVGKEYEVYPKNSNDFKARAFEINKDTIVFIKRGTLIKILKTEIETIEDRNFSYTGTAAIVLGAAAFIAFIISIVNNFPLNIPIGS